LSIPSLKVFHLPLLKRDICKSNNFIGKNKSSSFEPLFKWANMFALFHDYESFCSKIIFDENCFFESNLLQLVIKNKYSFPNMLFLKINCCSIIWIFKNAQTLLDFFYLKKSKYINYFKLCCIISYNFILYIMYIIVYLHKIKDIWNSKFHIFEIVNFFECEL